MTAVAKRLTDINIGDCTGGCNEVRLAAEAWLRAVEDGVGEEEAGTRLHIAAKSTLAKDDACGHHQRDDLLSYVAVHEEVLES